MATPEAKSSSKSDPITVTEIEQIARKKLQDNVYNYYACGVDEGRALSRNHLMYNRLLILPRVMRDVTHIDTHATIFGKLYPYPIAFAPSAMQKLAGGEGELDVAAAAKNLGINMTLSSQSTVSLEDVASTFLHGPGNPDLWFQLYLAQDPERSLPMIQRAERAGYTAVVLTVDTPILGNRWNERHTPLVLPAPLHLANYPKPTGPKKPTADRLILSARNKADAEGIIQQAGPGRHSSSLSWTGTIPWLRKHTKMKIILKGVMSPEDAALAVEHGADAIVVSNHGGRQLDDVPSTIEALPDIAAVVRKAIPVIVDGGVRRGGDVYKALALGADLVLVGRPVLWGLSWKGREGVEAVANILERELWRTMALAGVTSVKDIGRGSLAVEKREGFGVAKL